MASGLKVADYLATNPKVVNVIHPLMASHPQHQLAMSQHQGRHSGMVSVVLASSDQCQMFLSSLKLIRDKDNN